MGSSFKQPLMLLLAGAALALSGAVFAAGDESGSTNFTSNSSQNDEYDKGYTAAMKGSYYAAVAILNKVVANDPKHADA